MNVNTVTPKAVINTALSLAPAQRKSREARELR